MKIDIYAHIVTEKYMDLLYKNANIKFSMLDTIPTLVNLGKRFHIMDKFDDIMQVLVPGGPPLESVVDSEVAGEMVKLYNDEMAELVLKYPERFVAAVAALPLSDIEVTLRELERAIDDLRFRGIFLQTPVYSQLEDKSQSMVTKSLDSPEFIPIYEKMAKYNLPIWIHPWRLPGIPDYTSESRSKYHISQIFGWPYETTVAMTRLVFSGIFDTYPNLKFIIHHSGAMIPFFEQRISVGYNLNETRFKGKHLKGLAKTPLEYFRMFYADTAVSGSTPGLMCAYAFFGSGHVLFGTDMPYDSQIGYGSIKTTIESIDNMDIPSKAKEAIFVGNAKELLHLPI